MEGKQETRAQAIVRKVREEAAEKKREENKRFANNFFGV